MASLSLTPAAQAPPGSVSDLVNPSGVGFRITITNVVCVVLFMMVVIIRLITRCFLNRSFGHDDSLILFATASFLAVMGLFQWMVSLGLGKHLWNVSLQDYSPNFLRAWLAVAVLYSACMLTMKLSVLMLYRRLFPIQNFRIQWWSAFLFVNAYSILFIFASIFSCLPISAVWDVSISDAKCINRTGLYITYTVLNSISTWWILLMPMPIILSLALKNQQKMLLCSLFALGSLPCVTSIARLKVLVDWLHTGHNENDITFQLWSIVMWTQLELTVCMVCACGPTLRTFVDRQIKLVKTTLSSSQQRSWTRSSSWSPRSWSKSFNSNSNNNNNNNTTTPSTLSATQTSLHRQCRLDSSQASSIKASLPGFVQMLHGGGGARDGLAVLKTKTLVSSNPVCSSHDDANDADSMEEEGEEQQQQQQHIISRLGARTRRQQQQQREDCYRMSNNHLHRPQQGIMVHTSYQVSTVSGHV